MAGRASLPPELEGNRGIDIPRFNLDFTASLAPFPLTLHVGTLQWETEPLSAADVLPFLAGEGIDFFGLLFSLAPQQLHTELVRQEFDPNELFIDLVEMLSARRWWIGLKLVALAVAAWPRICADMLAVDATRLSLAGWLDVVTVQALQGMQTERATMLMSQIEIPPPGYEIPEEDFEMSQQQFLSLPDE